MVTCVGVALTKIEPLSGGAPAATLVTFVADHTGALITLVVSAVKVVAVVGVEVIGDANSSTLPLLESAAMSTLEAS